MLITLALPGCSGPTSLGTEPLPEETADWTDVAPIFGAHCGGCHLEGGVAGLPLSRWSEVQPARGAVQYAISVGQMPPWPAAPGDYPFQHDPSLSPEDLARLSGWLDAGAPLGAGDPDAVVEGPPPVGLTVVNAVLLNPDPYLPSAVEDDYRCFVLQPTAPVGPYLRGFDVVVDNLSVVHHAKLLAVTPLDGGAALAQLEAADPRPGFACDDTADPNFGGPATLVGGWLPGGGATVYPAGTGLPLLPGAVFVLTVHYHPPGSDGGTDQSRVDLWTVPAVSRPADATRITDLDWRLPPEEGGLFLPAGAADVAVSYRTRIGDLAVSAFDPEATGVDLLSAQFHMHTRGRHGQLRLRVGGEDRTLLDIPDWDFDWQLQYWLAEPLHLDPDDELTLSCEYDNSAGEQDITWGEGTEDEMCSAILNLLPSL